MNRYYLTALWQRVEPANTQHWTTLLKKTSILTDKGERKQNTGEAKQ